jgi:hypothetical protein
LNLNSAPDLDFLFMLDSGVVLIGAPGHRVNNSAVGCVYSYSCIHGNCTLVGVLEGVDSLGEFGYALSASGSVVAVAAPAASVSKSLLRAGAVYLIDANTLNGTVGDLETVCKVNGDRALGRAGMTITWNDVNGDQKPDLIVSSPMSNGILMYDNREAGAVAVWFETPKGVVSTSSVCVTHCSIKCALLCV